MLTIAFEFGSGATQGSSFADMTADYNLSAGRTWILVPTFMALGPLLVRRLFSAGGRGDEEGSE